MSFSPLALGMSLGAGLLALPSLVFTGEVLASYLPQRTRETTGTQGFRMVVLVPAHDEASGIEQTVAHLMAELEGDDELLIIADNCTDATAELARRAGAKVLERSDPDHHGKGYALSFGIDHLRSCPPDAVVIMDADCRLAQGQLRTLARRALAAGRPTQAVYLLEKPTAANRLSGISAFAFLVRNLLRPRGLARLGLPCELTGTGMAFPWPVLRDAPPTHGFLAEDRLLGHELALRGAPPQLDEATRVSGELASGAPSSLKQRRRWEHGGLALLLRVAPRLLGEGIVRRNLGLVAQGLDAAVPPLALLVLLEVGAMTATAGVWLLGGPALPFAILLVGFACLSLGVFIAWIASGRELLPPSEIVRIPRYVLWKLPVYASFARRGAHSRWERTDRS